MLFCIGLGFVVHNWIFPHAFTSCLELFYLLGKVLRLLWSLCFKVDMELLEFRKTESFKSLSLQLQRNLFDRIILLRSFMDDFEIYSELTVEIEVGF